MSAGLRQTLAVARREWMALVATPLFWVLSGVFFLASAFVFVSLLVGFATQSFAAENDIRANVTVAVIRDLFFVLHFFLLVQTPLLTMRAFAEERRQGTLALLMTTPSAEWPLVMGKFLANGGVVLLYLAITMVFPLAVEWVSDPEWPVIASCYVGLALAGLAYSALGLFFSAITDSQVIAAVFSYVALLGLLIASSMVDLVQSFHLGQLIRHLTLLGHLTGFLEGNVALEDAVYFVLFAFAFLFGAARLLESSRWRS